MDSGIVAGAPANNVGDGNIEKFDPILFWNKKRKSKSEPKSLRVILGQVKAKDK